MNRVFGRRAAAMGGGALGAAIEASVPYAAMTINQLCLALLLVLLQSALDPSRGSGVSATVLVVYGQLVSALVISSLAFLFERGKRPKPSFQILCWAFFVGLLQIPLGELLFTASLQYITATFQSVAMNIIPVLVFLLSVACRRERFHFWSLYGQAKLWGILVSSAGATVMVVLSDPSVQDSTLSAGGRFVGCLMVGLAVIAEAVSSILVERVALRYQADLTLSAMMNIFGTLQTVVLGALMERNPSSWRIRWRGGSLQLIIILYEGFVVTGLLYCTRNWCIHKKGPVFGTAFSPLLIVFSFLLETHVLGGVARVGSIVGAVLVVGGLYLLLWAKSKDYKAERTDEGARKHLMESTNAEPLLLNQA